PIEAGMKDALEALVREMFHSGMLYSDAVDEFKRSFIATVLRENRGNQLRTARELHIHRNTLRQTISELRIDPKAVRLSLRHRPPQTAHLPMSVKKQGRPS